MKMETLDKKKLKLIQKKNKIQLFFYTHFLKAK